MVRNYVPGDVEQPDRVTNKVLKAGVQTSYVHSSKTVVFYTFPCTNLTMLPSKQQLRSLQTRKTLAYIVNPTYHTVAKITYNVMLLFQCVPRDIEKVGS